MMSPQILRFSTGSPQIFRLMAGSFATEAVTIGSGVGALRLSAARIVEVGRGCGSGVMRLVLTGVDVIALATWTGARGARGAGCSLTSSSSLPRQNRRGGA